MPLLAPPIWGPDTVNLISMVLAKDTTSLLSSPSRIRVPPPAAPPRRELITTQPTASVWGSCHSNTISGSFSSNFFRRFSIFLPRNCVANISNQLCRLTSTPRILSRPGLFPGPIIRAGHVVFVRTCHAADYVRLTLRAQFGQQREYQRLFSLDQLFLGNAQGPSTETRRRFHQKIVEGPASGYQHLTGVGYTLQFPGEDFGRMNRVGVQHIRGVVSLVIQKGMNVGFHPLPPQ